MWLPGSPMYPWHGGDVSSLLYATPPSRSGPKAPRGGGGDRRGGGGSGRGNGGGRRLGGSVGGGGPGGAIWGGEWGGGGGGDKLPLPPLALNLTIPSP